MNIIINLLQQIPIDPDIWRQITLALNNTETVLLDAWDVDTITESYKSFDILNTVLTNITSLLRFNTHLNPAILLLSSANSDILQSSGIKH